MSGLAYRRKFITPDPKRPRPTTKGGAVLAIASVYEANDWDRDEQAKYHGSLGLDDKELHLFDVDELRTILADLEQSSMILFEEPAGENAPQETRK